MRTTTPAPTLETPTYDDQDLIHRAAASADKHPIKFTLTCLARHSSVPDPLLLAAAADASHRLKD